MGHLDFIQLYADGETYVPNAMVWMSVLLLISCWNSNPKGDSISRWRLWEVIMREEHEIEPSRMGVVVL